MDAGWATCGHGRPSTAKQSCPTAEASGSDSDSACNEELACSARCEEVGISAETMCSNLTRLWHVGSHVVCVEGRLQVLSAHCR